MIFRRYRVLSIIIIVTILLIWGHSMLPSDISSDESSWVLNLIRPFLEIFVGKGNVTVYLVRKLAHFSEYMLLGMEVSFLVFGIMKVAAFLHAVKCFFITEGCILLAAFIDETIQIFSGRGPMITDVWIDIAGGAAGAVIIICIRMIRQSIRVRNNS